MRRFPLLVRRLSTSTIEVEKRSFSRKDRLQNIVPNPALLRRLDLARVGFVPKAVGKVVSNKYKRGEHPLPDMQPPFPFTKKGKFLGKVQRWEEDLFSALDIDAPQVALIGRSNVGKSTLLNALLGFNSTYVQRAKTSPRPGETTELFFYQMGQVSKKQSQSTSTTETTPATRPKSNNDPALVIVDMPGYGFSYMSEEHQNRCRELCYGYLLGSQMLHKKQLKRVLLLIDARHGLKAADIEFLKDLEATTTSFKEDSKVLPKKLSWKLQVVFTKCDTIERRLLCKKMMLLEEEMRKLFPAWLFDGDMPVIGVSGLERHGILALQRELAALVAQPSRPSASASTVSTGKKIVFNSVDQYLNQGSEPKRKR